MRRTFALIVLLLCPSLAAAQTPVARLAGKARATVGETVILSPAGTISELPPFLKLATGPTGVVVPIAPLYSPDAKGGYSYFGGLAVMPQPGTYQFACVAFDLDDGGKPAGLDVAFLTVVVTSDAPTPGPAPTPAPTPTPPPPTPEPTPPPPPVPAWGPLAAVLVLYESQSLTGREAFYSTDSTDALTATVPVGPDGRPAWRIWDKDLDVSREPTWVDRMARAKADYTNPAAPKLFAFDAQNRVKGLDLPPATTPEQFVAIVAALKGTGRAQ